MTAREEARFFDVLAKLRAGDAEGLAQHKVPGTDDEEEDDSEADSEAAERGARPAKRAKLLKDVLAEQVCTIALHTHLHLHARNWNLSFAHIPCSQGLPTTISTHWSGAEPFFFGLYCSLTQHSSTYCDCAWLVAQPGHKCQVQS